MSNREDWRIRKQRQRERQRDAAKSSAASALDRIEADAECLAPAVMRNAVTAPDGHMLIGPRTTVANGRVSRADPIAGCKAFTEAQRHAARKLQLDYNDVGTGIGVGAVDYLRSGGGGGSGDGGHTAILEQCRARARLEGAMASAGALSHALARVVLDGVPISVWVQEPDPYGVERDTAAGVAWIGLGLDRLAAFYNPPVEARGVKIRTIGPGRGEYGLEQNNS
jgi:hypothetical protein